MKFCLPLILIFVAHSTEGALPFVSCERILSTMKDVQLSAQNCIEMNGYAYWKIEDWTTWTAGRAGCRQFPGGDLMSIHNFAENDLAIRLAASPDYRNRGTWATQFQTSSAWIGLYREGPDPNTNEECLRKYNRWSDGTSVDYTFWGRHFNNDQEAWHQPDCQGGRESFVHIVSSFGPDGESKFWNDVDENDFSLSSLCKVPI